MNGWLGFATRGQVMLHRTSSDRYAYDAAVSDFRRAGLDI
jgi:hypothetical protein